VITTKNNSSFIDVFTVGTDGRPSATFVANSAATPIPFGFTFNDNDHLVVAEAANSTLSTYTVGADGTVKSIASQPDGGAAMCWVTHAAGRFYVTDTGSNNLTGYQIDPAGIPSVFTQINIGAGPIDLIGTLDGQFLYVEIGGAGGLDGFTIKPDGTLTQVVALTGLGGLEGIAAT
jgi:DNA-binding beta-propeller fold protein YncE